MSPHWYRAAAFDCGMRPHRHRLSDLIDRHNRHLELETEENSMPQFSLVCRRAVCHVAFYVEDIPAA